MQTTLVRRSKLVWTVALNVAAAALLGLLVVKGAAVLSWVLIALLLAVALDIPVRWLEAHRVNRGVAVALVLTGVLGLLVLLGATIGPMIADQVRKLVSSAPDLLAQARETRIARWMHAHDITQRVEGELRQSAGEIAKPAIGAVASVVRGTVALVTILAVTVFMLLGGGEVFRGAMQWFPPNHSRIRAMRLALEMRARVGGFMVGTALIGLLAGVLTGVALAILKVPYYLALAVLVAVFSLVPIIGATLAGIVVVLVVLATVGVKTAIGVLIGYLVYQQLEGDLLQPLVQRKTIKLNPLLIMLAMLVGTAVAGVLGALLALPITGAAQVVVLDVLRHRKERWRQQGIGRRPPRRRPRTTATAAPH